MWPTILGWLVSVTPVIPSLVVDIENVFRGQPKTGEQKAAALTAVLSNTVNKVATIAAQAAPPGTTSQQVAQAMQVFSTAVGNATVQLANDLQVFPHTPTPESK